MMNLSSSRNQIKCVANFQDLISTPFNGDVNAISWKRELVGDFSEIVKEVELNGNIVELNQDELRAFKLSEQGQLAREILLNDFELLKAHGASPVLNVIKYYERDDAYPFFPTDVYSFHVDRAAIPTDTFLCTYQGESSQILPNSEAIQKILIPEIRTELKKLYGFGDEGFNEFLTEYFFDLHYQAMPGAQTVALGQGHFWKLAVDHSESLVSPCIHRAPKEINDQIRLLMIC
ncbi:MAG: hypothetical protein P8Q42_06430 [Flavobacteriales bacterium]|nr:hypothetical protein [Flavobacteriales bacterium]